MLRRILTTIFLLCIILTFPTYTHAFIGLDLTRSVPYVNCGVAGDDSTKACCYYDPVSIDKLPYLVEKIFDLWGLLPAFIPTPAKTWNAAREYFLNFQHLYAGSKPCFAGAPFPPGILPTDDACTCEVYPDQAREPLFNLCKERLSPVNRGNTTPLSPKETARLEHELDNCINCASDNGYYSAIGCVKFSLADFITRWIFGLGVSLAGLFALMCIIVAALRIQLAQGNAETVTKSREMITSCILGLLLIIFSVFLLNLAGITFLPGLFF